jgi:tetratricopeptide (TPR) repeat protein
VASELVISEGIADAARLDALPGAPAARGSGLAREAAAPRGTPPLPRSLQRRGASDDGAGLLDLIAAEVEQSRKSEVAAALEACRSLYASPETRFRAAACLTKFQSEFGDEPGAEEGLLLIGILRMDFAQDHQAAIRYFERFLKRSPEGPLAELAHYRIFLAATERGIVSDALRKGREYLERYPEGRYVGRVIQRFPELKRAL